MKNDIKFRIWDNLKAEWCDNQSIWRLKTSNNGAKIEPPAIYFNQHPDGVTIQQYTGLKDKNQNDIYQGDILQYQYLDNNNFYEATGEVIWNTGIDCYNNMFAGWEVTFGQKTKYINKNCEVIGNIFENPELLDDTKISVKIEKRGRGRPKKEIF